MLQQRRAACEAVAKQLFEAEAALDIALAAVAGLTVTMPAARKEANLSIMYAQEAFESASETIGHLTQARRTIINTHKALHEAQHQMGLGRIAFGPNDDKPEGSEPQPIGVHLRTARAA